MTSSGSSAPEISLSASGEAEDGTTPDAHHHHRRRPLLGAVLKANVFNPHFLPALEGEDEEAAEAVGALGSDHLRLSPEHFPTMLEATLEANVFNPVFLERVGNLHDHVHHQHHPHEAAQAESQDGDNVDSGPTPEPQPSAPEGHMEHLETIVSDKQTALRSRAAAESTKDAVTEGEGAEVAADSAQMDDFGKVEAADSEGPPPPPSDAGEIKVATACPRVPPALLALRRHLSGAWHFLVKDHDVFLIEELRLLAAICAVIAGLWSVLYLVVGDDAAPGGQLFALIVVYLSSMAMGELVALLGFHPLCGMLLAGFICRFVPGVNAGMSISKTLAGAIRNFGLCTILLRAGIALDVPLLRQLMVLCTIISILPTVVEATIVGALSTALLNFGWAWAALAGCIICGNAPAIVVPALLHLQEQGYGVAKGIPSLVLAVSALNDVYAVVGNAVFIKLATGSSSSLAMSILRAPIELAMGFAVGVGLGLLGVFLLPPRSVGKVKVKADGDLEEAAETAEGVGASGPLEEPNTTTAWLRALFALGTAFWLINGGHEIEYSGAGAMAVLVLGTALQLGWGPAATTQPQLVLLYVWSLFAQPLLFGVIGAAINPKYFTGGFLWRAFIILLIAIGARIAVTVACGINTRLNTRERAFLALAWMPKATVQAALAPVPLTLVAATMEPEHTWAQGVFALAMLAVVITAPVGAVVLRVTGHRLLKKNEVTQGFGGSLAGH